MSDHENFSQHNGIRALTESDRSPEYKEARGRFSRNVNDLLAQVQERQEKGETVGSPEGHYFSVGTESVITTTRLGALHKRGVVTVVFNYEPGISLTGDGVTSPLVLQMVLPDGDNGSVTEICGEDLMLRKTPDGKHDFTPAARGDVAKVRLTNVITGDDSVDDVVQEYRVSGNGNTYAPSRITEDRGSDDNGTAKDPWERIWQDKIDGMITGDMVVHRIAETMGIKLKGV